MYKKYKRFNSDRCRKFAKRARRYIVNYDILDNELYVPAEQKSLLIEEMPVERKSHRNDKDFAYKFVNNNYLNHIFIQFLVS